MSEIHDFLLAPISLIEVLGAMIGSMDERNRFFEDRLVKLIQLRGDLADIEDAGIELMLGSLCANMFRVTHLLRAHGSQLC